MHKMKKILSLALLALVFGFSQTAFAQTVSVNECCWVDIKTGKRVPSVPSSGINHISDLEDLYRPTGKPWIADPGIALIAIDGKSARNTRTGQQYAKESDGCCVDIKTGK